MEKQDLIERVLCKLPDKISVSDFLLMAIVITGLCAFWKYFFGS